jgi:pyruvate carboxylase
VQAFFEVNGQPRTIFVQDRAAVGEEAPRLKADPGAPGQVGAPMAGIVSQVLVREGQHVAEGEALLSLEAMKMVMQVTARRSGRVLRVLTEPGQAVETSQLLVELAVVELAEA